MTSYRKITSNIAGKLNLQETYLLYCLALCSDCNTMESYIKQDNLTDFYGIKKTDQIREWLHKFESLGLVSIDKFDVYGQYGKFNRCFWRLSSSSCDSNSLKFSRRLSSLVFVATLRKSSIN